MENFCQRIRERAEILGVELTIMQQQRYNKYVNDRIEDGVHVNDALDFIYMQMRNEFNIVNKVDKINLVEKSNINYFIEKFEGKLNSLRERYDKTSKLNDDKNMEFRAKEMIYIDICNCLKIIKINIENNSK